MEKEKIIKDYEKKIKLFDKYNKHYYEKSAPLISDYKFDNLKHQILLLEKKYPYLKSEKSPSSLDIIEKEDQEIVKSVQRGILSNTYKRGRYSPRYELGVHHFHRLISKSL